MVFNNFLISPLGHLVFLGNPSSLSHMVSFVDPSKSFEHKEL